MNNTYIDMVLMNGKEVKLTYYFRALEVVFSKHEDLKAAWLNAAVKGTNDSVDIVKGLYIGYLCGQVEQVGGICSLKEDVYTLEQFMELISQDIYFVHNTWSKFISPKKKPDLEKPSPNEQAK